MMRNLTDSFLERERYHLAEEQAFCTIIHRKNKQPEQQQCAVIENKKRSVASDEGVKKGHEEEEFSVSRESIKEGRYAPQRYKTTCYFQPKQYPVKYSETVIVNIGSDKKLYFDSIYYMTKMQPNRWTESMETLTPAAVSRSEITIPVKEDCHYMSLELQQPQLVQV